jgi:hypothetical protein
MHHRYRPELAPELVQRSLLTLRWNRPLVGALVPIESVLVGVTMPLVGSVIVADPRVVDMDVIGDRVVDVVGDGVTVGSVSGDAVVVASVCGMHARVMHWQRAALLFVQF